MSQANWVPSVRDLPGMLPLSSCALTVSARGGLGRVVLTQRFRNEQREPLAVTYKLPLPEDAAVSDFSFTVGETRVQGVVQKKSDARETYERALAEGRSAALLEQERTSLFVQEIGNVPPGQTLEVQITLDQPLTWLGEGWEWRFPLTAAPRFLGPNDDPSLGAASPHFAAEVTPARASLFLAVRDRAPRSPESPTHPLTVRSVEGGFDLELGSGNSVPLDRDLVVRWPASGATFETTIDARAEGQRAFGLLTMVPPTPAAAPRPIPRDLTLLLDTSGSMHGEPLEQEKRIACALIDGLRADDTLELLEFSSQIRAYAKEPVRVTPAVRKDATRWVQKLVASGGTEMVSGIEAAMRELRPESQRQIVLVTDGLVGFEQRIVSALLARLPRRARLHAIGVGSAVNRSLVAPIARAGRGLEAVVGLGEDAERTAQRVLAHTGAPLAVDLEIDGSAVRRVVPARLGDVFAGSPLRVALELDPRGGEVVVRGRTADGPFTQHVQVAPVSLEPGSAVAKRFARELVADLEMSVSAGEPREPLEREIERVGLELAIATSQTSWVAATVTATADPRDPTRHVVQPQAAPFGTSAEGLGLRPKAPGPMAFGSMQLAMPAGGGALPSSVARMRRGASLGAPPAAPRSAAVPPPPGSPAPKGGSVLKRVARFVQAAVGGGPVDAHATGRLLAGPAGGCVVEWDSEGFTLDLQTVTAHAVLADGSTVTATLQLEASTASGPIAAGLRVRLVFAGLADAKVVVVSLPQPDGGTLTVTAS